ncbi:MAG TPA: DUF5985 family protein [Acetobacteraceae bacterium]|nr:DUF5985 family protein [Acetobacteraceae bacterium]
MSELIYGLCAVTSSVCAYLLLTAYWRGRFRLLLWSGLCFFGLAATNVLLVLDKFVFTTVDLSIYRNLLSLIAMAILIFGLIWDSK